MNSQIMIRCDKGYNLNLVRVTATSAGILLEYGGLVDGIFWAADNETLNYHMHEELRGIFDGLAWDVEMLSDLVNQRCREVE